MKNIPLTKFKKTIVDDDVFEAIKHVKWYAFGSSGQSYAARKFCKEDGTRGVMFLHHCVTGSPLYGMVVKHKRNSLDNRRENLEIVSKRQNQQDRKNHRLGRLVGATPHHGGWCSQIHIDGKTHYLGFFPTEAEAHVRYIQELRILGITPHASWTQQKRAYQSSWLSGKPVGAV